MKISHLRLLSVVFLMMFGGNKIRAQVTIGSDIPPVKFALLQIKEVQPTIGNEGGVTVRSGAFLLPRVKLTILNTLSDLSIENPTQDETRKEHIGLMVFNVNTTDAIRPGLYVWDGEQWLFLILE